MDNFPSNNRLVGVKWIVIIILMAAAMIVICLWFFEFSTSESDVEELRSDEVVFIHTAREAEPIIFTETVSKSSERIISSQTVQMDNVMNDDVPGASSGIFAGRRTLGLSLRYCLDSFLFQM